MSSLGMALGRATWIDKVRAYLEVALGEYAKQQYADLIGYQKGSWAADTGRIVRKIELYFDGSKIKTKGTWKKDKAFSEALSEAELGGQCQILKSRYAIESKLSPEEEDLFSKMTQEHFDDFDADKLLRQMLVEHSPTLSSITARLESH